VSVDKQRGVGLTTPQMTDAMVSNRRRLPNPKVCRTRYLGKDFDLSQCMVKNPNACRYAIPLSGVLCRHPDRRSFEKAGSP
jgi:hypothetical protein